MTPIRIFISSVQREFASEREQLRVYLRGDPLMRRFFEVFLFEDVPASDRRPDEVYLGEVERCDIYVGLFGRNYGFEDTLGVSPTEREFDRATELESHRLIFVRGAGEGSRHPKMQALVDRAQAGLVRRRFATQAELVAEHTTRKRRDTTQEASDTTQEIGDTTQETVDSHPDTTQEDGGTDRRTTQERLLLKEIPNKAQWLLGITVAVNLKSESGREYLEVVVRPHPNPISYKGGSYYGLNAAPPSTRSSSGSFGKQPEDDQKTTRKQPEGNDTSQSVADRIVTFLRGNPSASRRTIVAALQGTTEGSIRYQLDKLKSLGKLRRVGPDRGGRWVVVDGFDVAGDGESDGCAENQRPTGGAPPENDRKTTRNDGHLPEKNQKTTRRPPDPLPLPDRILALLRQNSTASRREIAATLGTTESTVRYRLDKLRSAGKIARVGPDKGGHWKVLDDSTTEPDPSPARDPGSPR